MPFSIGGLIQGLTTGARGIQEGISERRKLEQQALRQALADRLMSAQIGNFQSEIQRRAAQTDWERQQPRAPVMGSPEWITAQGAGARARGLATADIKASVPLSPGERRAAEQVVVALRNMKRLYAEDPTSAQTPWQTAAAEGLGHIPLIGGAAKGLAGPAGQRAMTRGQQEFQRNAVTLRHHYAAILPHTRLALGLLEDVNKSMVPPAGTDPEAIATGFAPAWDETLSQIEPLVSAAPRPAPRAPAAPAAPPAPRYHPQFHTP